MPKSFRICVLVPAVLAFSVASTAFASIYPAPQETPAATRADQKHDETAAKEDAKAAKHDAKAMVHDDKAENQAALGHRRRTGRQVDKAGKQRAHAEKHEAEAAVEEQKKSTMSPQ